MERIDWTLLVLAAAGDTALTPVQLQKALFLIGKTMPSVEQTGFYTFKAYNYGPFCQSIYADAERLRDLGFVDVSPAQEQSWNVYRITEAGLAKSKDVRKILDGAQYEYVERLINWMKSLSFEQLLSFVYTQYPETAVNSMFRVKR